MQTNVDKFGRVLIPKPLRDELGLTPGDSLRIETKGDRIVLRSMPDGPHLVEKGGVTVFTGSATGDLASAVEAGRRERIKKAGGMGRK
jgi:AbrB family looped-hinge helix DNA binding protein